jgi:hypothetical protein
LEDKIGFGDTKPLLINQEGAFFISKEGRWGRWIWKATCVMAI